MSAKSPVLKGVVRDGVIVFEAPWPLPDGTEVEFTVTRHVFTLEERAEWEQWERISDEALARFEEQLDKEEQEDRKKTGAPPTTDPQ